ncbi:hypothetical protein ACVWWG_004586 [Bradyrhizobium sp. LB7.2]
MVTAIMAGTAIVVITTAGIMGVAIGGIVTKGGDWAGLDGRPGFDAHRGLARVIVLLESNSTMKVRELVQELQALPDQDAIVVIGEGSNPLDLASCDRDNRKRDCLFGRESRLR